MVCRLFFPCPLPPFFQGTLLRMKPCTELGSIPFLSVHSSVLCSGRSLWIMWWTSVQTGFRASSRADSSTRRSTRKNSALPGIRSWRRPLGLQVASRGSPGGAHSASLSCHLMSQSRSRPLLHRILPLRDCDTWVSRTGIWAGIGPWVQELGGGWVRGCQPCWYSSHWSYA